MTRAAEATGEVDSSAWVPRVVVYFNNGAAEAYGGKEGARARVRYGAAFVVVTVEHGARIVIPTGNVLRIEEE